MHFPEAGAWHCVPLLMKLCLHKLRVNRICAASTLAVFLVAASRAYTWYRWQIQKEAAQTTATPTVRIRRGI